MDFFTKTVSAAVTGLESKLDSVLLGPDSNTNSKSDSPKISEEKKDVQTYPSTASAMPKRIATPPVSGGAASRMSLQERLAAATARSVSATQRVGNLQRNIESPSASARSSIDTSRSKNARGGNEDTGNERADEQCSNGIEKAEVTAEVVTNAFTENMPESQDTENKDKVEDNPTINARKGTDQQDASPKKQEQDEIDIPIEAKSSETGKTPAVITTPIASGANGDVSLLSDSELRARITQLEADLALCESRRQEESHAASERIDALEEKIKYLARESVEASKLRASSLTAGGLEKKLAEKDEKIALLLEEGERLSKLELKNMTLIKKLRAKVAEDEKANAEIKKRLDKAEKELAESRDRLMKAAETEKSLNEKMKSFTRLEREIEAIRREGTNKDSQLLDLRSQLELEQARAERAEGKAQAEALETERKAAVELREQLEKLQSEAVLVEENLRSEIKDLKMKLQRDNERTKMVEAELKNELQVAESKVEVLRARAEEVSSGAAGNTHAKLLRQVETLQTQYAIASENWKGIESSLLARVAALEKERNELATKEADTRRRAREFNLKAKRKEGDLQALETKVNGLEEEVDDRDRKIDSLSKELTKLDAALEGFRETIRNAREEFDKELSSRLEEERAKWIESLPLMRSASPPPPLELEPRLICSPTFTADADGLGINSYVNSPRRETFRPPSTDLPTDGRARGAFRSRLSISSPTGLESALSPQRYGHPLSSLQHNASRSSLPIVAAGESAIADEDDDYFHINRDGNNIHPGLSSTPISPHPRNFTHDLMSASTVAAGPSVQLVERMSATVRRLGTEKAATKEELARMTAQRDEARQEIVELMREVEKKREFERRCKALEEEIQDLNIKHDTTLELLGEKAEEVEELKADVTDLKQMYRDLVSSTMK